MRIRELKLIRYGKFTDRHLSLPRQARDIHLIVGPNEAGKSTVRTAIGDWLFGIPVKTRLAFVHPMPELRVGGVLERMAPSDQEGQLLAFDRTKGNRNTVRTPEDGVLADAVLQPWLGGMQLNAFHRMYALDHATLVDGGAGILSASDDIGRLLFQSAAGIEGLGGVLEKLQAEADGLWGPRRANSRTYYQAQEAYEAAGVQFKQATLRARDWKAQHEALQSTAQALEAARQRDKDARLKLSQLERIRRVRPMLQALDSAQTFRDEQGLTDEVPLLPENASSVIREAAQSLALAQADMLRLDQERATLNAQLDGIQIDGTVLSLAADITDLNERRLQFRSHQADIIKRSEEIQTHWARVRELAGDLAWPSDSEEIVRKRLPSAPTRARLSQLLKAREAHTQKLRSAQAALSDRERQIDLAQDALSRLGAQTAQPGLADAVEKALKLGDHAASVSLLWQEAAAHRMALEAALAGLGKWRCDITALANIVVPEDSLLQSMMEESKSDAVDLQGQQEALTAKSQDLQRLELELQQFVQGFQPVSREQVDQVRKQRDYEWQSIKSTPDELVSRTNAYEQWVSKADVLADNRLDWVQHEAAHRSKAERIAQVRLELEQQQSKLQAVVVRKNERERQWHGLAQAAGLPELPLSTAQTWLRQRQRALDVSAQLAQTEQRHQAAQARGTTLAEAIWSLLGDDQERTPVPELADCVKHARAVLSEIEQARGQRSTLEQQVTEARNSLAGLQGGVQEAREAKDAWEATWQTAVQSAGYEASAPADQIEAELDVIHEVDRLLTAIRGIRSDRIDPMQTDLADLKASAIAIALRAAPELAEQEAEFIAQELFVRLTSAKQSEQTVLKLRSQLSQTEAKHQDAQERQLAQESRLAPLMAAAGVDEIHALNSAVEQSERRREVERKMQGVLSDLAQSGDGLDIEVLRQEAFSVEPDELKAELERLSAVSAQCVEEIAQLSSQHGTQKKAFEALAGADAAAQAESRRQEAVSAMADAADRYIKLQTAARLLKWSMEKFRETRQGPMLAKASATFNALTLGSFERLLVDSEEQPPRLFGIRPDGAQVEVSGMSEGSRDQLYLALRLSALELQIEQGLNMPLIADDLFINFDDRRTAAGLEVLGELSRSMQVVFLTHHDHLVPLAREVLGSDLNVLEL